MNDNVIFGVPIACLAFLFGFSTFLLPLQVRSTADRGKETNEHSERLYKDYELFLKVMMALVGAFGYVRLSHNGALARDAMIGIGSIGLLVAVTMSIFVICHLGSKVRRWENIEWGKAFFWQELWACVSMFARSAGLWFAAFKW